MYQTNTRNVVPTLGLTIAPYLYEYIRRIFSVDTEQLIIAVTLTVASQHPCLNVCIVCCEPIVVFHHLLRHASPLCTFCAAASTSLSSVVSSSPFTNVTPARTYCAHHLTVVFWHNLRCHISPVCPYCVVMTVISRYRTSPVCTVPASNIPSSPTASSMRPPASPASA